MDHLTPEKRSWNMARIKSRDTSAEKQVRSMLHRLGFRFRLDRRDLPGRPDIVLPKYRTVIFVHGCFWHRHANCKETTVPQTHTDYWLNKFRRNVERDKTNQERLSVLGWKVRIIWTCQLTDKEKTEMILRRCI